MKNENITDKQLYYLRDLLERTDYILIKDEHSLTIEEGSKLISFLNKKDDISIEYSSNYLSVDKDKFKNVKYISEEEIEELEPMLRFLNLRITNRKIPEPQFKSIKTMAEAIIIGVEETYGRYIMPTRKIEDKCYTIE